MASRPIRAERFEILDGLGIEGVGRIFLEEGSVAGLVRRLFSPRSEGEKPGYWEFYEWLDERSYRAEWARFKSLKGTLAADQALDIALNTSERTVKSDRLKVDTLKWQASKYNPAEFGEKLGIDVTASIGKEWAEAIAAIEAKPAPLIEAEVVEEDDPPALPAA